MSLNPDEYLVSKILLFPKFIEHCVDRIYHIEIYESLNPPAEIPCIVYKLTDETPEQEISGDPKFFTALYELVIIAKESQVTREIAEEIKETFATEAYNNAMYAETSGQMNWITAESDGEDGEFAIEQQEKGYKTSTIVGSLEHWKGDPE